MIFQKCSSALFSVCWVDWSPVGSQADMARHGQRKGLIASCDVMAVDPHFLTISPCPVTRLPDIIHAAIPVSGAANIIGPIINRDAHGTWIAAIVRSRPVVRSVARVSGVITFTSGRNKRSGKQGK